MWAGTSPHPGASKNLTRGEAERLSEAGIDLVLFFQTTRGFMISDRASGARDAKSALAQARACGMPEGRPLYFALDTDPRPLTPTEWNKVFGYLDGAAAVIGRGNVGIYGGRLAIDRALGATKAMWGWQTKSWSEGWSAKAHVQQYKHDVPLGRGRVDRDRAMTTDFGQWKVGDDMPLTDADKKWLEQEIRDAVNKHASHDERPTCDPRSQPAGQERRKRVGAGSAELGLRQKGIRLNAKRART